MPPVMLVLLLGSLLHLLVCSTACLSADFIVAFECSKETVAAEANGDSDAGREAGRDQAGHDAHVVGRRPPDCPWLSLYRSAMIRASSRGAGEAVLLVYIAVATSSC
jgi:hypothetical protein